MKVKVLKEFRDKDNYAILYTVGMVCEFDNPRASSLIDRGLVEEVREEIRRKAVNEDK